MLIRSGSWRRPLKLYVLITDQALKISAQRLVDLYMYQLGTMMSSLDKVMRSTGNGYPNAKRRYMICMASYALLSRARASEGESQ